MKAQIHRVVLLIHLEDVEIHAGHVVLPAADLPGGDGLVAQVPGRIIGVDHDGVHGAAQAQPAQALRLLRLHIRFLAQRAGEHRQHQREHQREYLLCLHMCLLL